MTPAEQRAIQNVREDGVELTLKMQLADMLQFMHDVQDLMDASSSVVGFAAKRQRANDMVKAIATHIFMAARR